MVRQIGEAAMGLSLSTRLEQHIQVDTLPLKRAKRILKELELEL